MPHCLNDNKALYKGNEPSPKGLGYCAHAMKEGVIMTGKDSRKWIIKKDKNNVKKWMIYNDNANTNTNILNYLNKSKKKITDKELEKLLKYFSKNYSKVLDMIFSRKIQKNGKFFVKSGKIIVIDPSFYGEKSLAKFGTKISVPLNSCWKKFHIKSNIYKKTSIAGIISPDCEKYISKIKWKRVGEVGIDTGRIGLYDYNVGNIGLFETYGDGAFDCFIGKYNSKIVVICFLILL